MKAYANHVWFDLGVQRQFILPLHQVARLVIYGLDALEICLLGIVIAPVVAAMEPTPVALYACGFARKVSLGTDDPITYHFYGYAILCSNRTTQPSTSQAQGVLWMALAFLSVR